MSSSNCCFLTCTQVSQEAGKVVWYSHLFKNFPQFVVIHEVKGFHVVNETEVDVFLEFSCFFSDPTDVGNLNSGSSAFSFFFFFLSFFFLLYNIVLVLPYINMHSPWVYMCSPSSTPFPPPSPSPDFSKFSLYIWNFSISVLLNPSLKDFECYLASMWDEYNYGSLNILCHCLSLGLGWKLTFFSPVATTEFSRFAGILNAASFFFFFLGFEIAQLEFHHLH